MTDTCTVFVREWEWQSRRLANGAPFAGYSLHLSHDDAEQFSKRHWESMSPLPNEFLHEVNGTSQIRMTHKMHQILEACPLGIRVSAIPQRFMAKE